ncbi:MAG: hypothetical protein J7480_03300 [Microbacteriaceae bacterium]|nr:hypothetical protein [Microbacteriaceae bacterium]
MRTELRRVRTTVLFPALEYFVDGRLGLLLRHPLGRAVRGAVRPMALDTFPYSAIASTRVARGSS